MSDIRVCTAKRLPEHLRGRARELAIAINPENAAGIPGPHISRASMSGGKKWSNGHVIRVAFLDGTDIQRARVQPYFHRWQRYANLTFLFVANPLFSDVRVSFMSGQGSWSYVGVDCLMVEKADPTMVLGWLENETDEEEYRRVVLHECGHVLGFDHEDQQPAETIQWNIPRVIAYYTGPPNDWPVSDVYSQVLDKIVDPQELHTAFDPRSIMAYSVPPEFTFNHVGVPFNTDLSAMDEEFAAQMYPDMTTPESFPRLPIGGPQTICTLTSSPGMANLTFTVPEDGVYRIWTSSLGGPLCIYAASDTTTPLFVASQQITTRLDKGDYVVRAHAGDSNIDGPVRVHAKGPL